MKFITTSWDDGHPLDLKLAALLNRYNIDGTFYIPKENAERKVMNELQIKLLSSHFEIGGHTLNHVRLSSKDKETAFREIYGSYYWLADLLGAEPVSFCFPGGKYDADLIEIVFENKYSLVRTAELLHMQQFNKENILHTALQVYKHSMVTYTKHLLKRKRYATLIHLLTTNSSTDILKLTEHYLNNIKDNEIFHLWGHSWEIDEYNLWYKLEEILRLISNNNQFNYIENKDTLHMQGLIQNPNISIA